MIINVNKIENAWILQSKIEKGFWMGYIKIKAEKTGRLYLPKQKTYLLALDQLKQVIQDIDTEKLLEKYNVLPYKTKDFKVDFAYKLVNKFEKQIIPQKVEKGIKLF